MTARSTARVTARSTARVTARAAGGGATADGAAAVAVVPHTHWDREWYDPFQTFRLKLVRLVDELLDLMESDASYTPLPARRAAGCGRRLPGDPARERGQAAGAGRGRPADRRAVVRPHGRVPGVGRDDRPQPAEGHPAGQRLRWGDGGRLPARHVRPRRPDAPDPRPGRASTTPWSGGACRRPWTGRPSCGRRPTARACGPSTWSPGTATVPRCPRTPSNWCVGSVRWWTSSPGTCDRGEPMLLMNGSDHLRPQPWLGRVVAEANALQDELELSVASLSGVPRRDARRRGWSSGAASCAPAPGRTC